MLYDIDLSAWLGDLRDPQDLLLSMVSGDRHRCTVFALGVMPYITASLAVWIVLSVGGSGLRNRFSPQRTERFTLALALPLAAFSAVLRAWELPFRETFFDAGVLRIIAAAEMTAGAAVICLLAGVNRERGIGGHAPVLLVNIADNLLSTLHRFPWEQLRRLAALCVVMAAVVLVMENVIVRLPVQRVSIHSDYAEKSRIALKLAPIGVMPVMFAASFSALPRLLVRLLLFLGGENPALRRIYEALSLTRGPGAAVYVATVFLLNIAFSFAAVSPGEIADQLQRAGDSIVNVYAGVKTRRYLRGILLRLCLVSGSVLCLMMGCSLALALTGEIPAELALFPATAMILTGILYPLYREVRAYREFDSYSFFI
nr:hypothetical protein [uncultured Oscillibacter sp.]